MNKISTKEYLDLKDYLEKFEENEKKISFIESELSKLEIEYQKNIEPLKEKKEELEKEIKKYNIREQIPILKNKIDEYEEGNSDLSFIMTEALNSLNICIELLEETSKFKNYSFFSKYLYKCKVGDNYSKVINYLVEYLNDYKLNDKMNEFPSIMELIVLGFSVDVIVSVGYVQTLEHFRNLYKKFGHYYTKIYFYENILLLDNNNNNYKTIDDIDNFIEGSRYYNNKNKFNYTSDISNEFLLNCEEHIGNYY